jgi:hypothetical protein
LTVACLSAGSLSSKFFLGHFDARATWLLHFFGLASCLQICIQY